MTHSHTPYANGKPRFIRFTEGAEKFMKASSQSSQTTQQELAKLGFNDWVSQQCNVQ